MDVEVKKDASEQLTSMVAMKMIQFACFSSSVSCFLSFSHIKGSFQCQFLDDNMYDLTMKGKIREFADLHSIRIVRRYRGK
jgi:hypothetical protein